MYYSSNSKFISMKLFKILILWILISGCSDSQKIKSCDYITRIKVFNKTVNRKLPNVTILTQSEIKEFCTLFSNIYLYKDRPNIRNQYGFYDFSIYDENGSEIEFHVIFTKYDGIILWYNGNYYKQDRFGDFVNRIIGPIFPK